MRHKLDKQWRHSSISSSVMLSVNSLRAEQPDIWHIIIIIIIISDDITTCYTVWYKTRLRTRTRYTVVDHVLLVTEQPPDVFWKKQANARVSVQLAATSKHLVQQWNIKAGMVHVGGRLNCVIPLLHKCHIWLLQR